MMHPQVKREFFTQLPNKLIDSDLSANAFKGFVRMLRDREIASKENFVGSPRKLANRIHMPHTTIVRIIDEWEQAGLIYRETQPRADENRQDMVMYLLIDTLWIQNSEACRKECTKLVQRTEEDVPDSYTDVPIWYSAVPNRDGDVPTSSVNEATNTIGNTTVDTKNNTNQEREETRTPDAHEPVQVDVPTVTSPSPSSSSSQQGEIHGIPDSDAHSHAGSAHHDIGRTLVHPPASSGDTHRTEEAHQQEIASYSPETRTDTGMQENEGKVEQPPLVEVPLSEPDMTGKWSAEKCVQYDEWTQGKRYATPTERNAQLAVARQFQRDLPDLTLERYKLVFDDWHTWWKSKGKGWFHVSDLAVKQQNKITRLKNALNRLDAPPETNIRRLPSSTTTRRYNEPTPEEYAEVSETERRQRENFEKNGGLARLEQMKAERLAARRA